MRLFGFDIARQRSEPKSELAVAQKTLTLSPAIDNHGSWVTILDRPPGAFQKDLHVDPWRVQRNWTIFACQTLIAGDMGKLPVRLMQENKQTGIYERVESAAFSPVLSKPNPFQTWQKFVESWIFSKLTGNAYILKERDNRGVVTAMYVLNPMRVMPLIAPDGSVFYELGEDDLSAVPTGLPAAPASEIMHDRMWCLFHPLVGVSPIFANGLAATQGLEIQQNSARFFANQSRPGGMLLAPGAITDETAARLKLEWEKKYASTNPENVGRIAVLGDGLKFESMTTDAVDAQMAEQLAMTGMMICSTYHVPGYKVGVGPTPTYQNAEVLNQIYYDDCLQTLIQGVESQLEEGLGLTKAGYCAMLDLDYLLRMDSATQVETLNKSVAGGWMSPNEARQKRNMKPVKGGESPMIQQQNYSLAALAKRDSGPNPFGNPKPAPGAADPAPPADPPPNPDDAKAKSYAVIARARKALRNAV